MADGLWLCLAERLNGFRVGSSALQEARAKRHQIMDYSGSLLTTSDSVPIGCAARSTVAIDGARGFTAK